CQESIATELQAVRPVSPGGNPHEVVISELVHLMGTHAIAARECSHRTPDNKPCQAAASRASRAEADEAELVGGVRLLVDGILFPFIQSPSEPAFNHQVRRYKARIVRYQAVVVTLRDIAARIDHGSVGRNIQ